MDCNDCQELFSEYLDRLMDAPQRHLLEKHLEECPACAEEWESFAAAVRWVRQMQFTAPAGTLEGIRQRIGSNHPEENLLRRFLTFLRFQDFSLPLPAAAATLAVALLAMLAVKHFAAGNLPIFQGQQRTAGNHLAQSVPAVQAGAKGYAAAYHIQAPPMYQQPGQDDAAFSDFGGILPLQQLGMQFVTAGGPAPTAFSMSPHAHPFYSMFATHLPPDVRILVNNLPLANRLQLSRQLMHNPAWSARHYGSDTILLHMDPCELKKLHGLLAGHNILIFPPDATDPAFGSPKKVLTVAVRLH